MVTRFSEKPNGAKIKMAMMATGKLTNLVNECFEKLSEANGNGEEVVKVKRASGK